ncbi:hypothetical protein H7H98_03230 [Mycolicibacterium sphagni]|nr:hypothetical protein [Mycolicibacterium sphagni]
MESLKSEHLPPALQAIAEPIETLAHTLVAKLKDGPQLTTALHDLVVSKDSFVRQRVRDLKAAGAPAPVNNPEPELR